MQAEWLIFRAEFCKVEAVCMGFQVNWLGWAVIYLAIGITLAPFLWIYWNAQLAEHDGKEQFKIPTLILYWPGFTIVGLWSLMINS